MTAQVPHKNTISMCLIVKNEPHLEKCILSFKDCVDEIVIVDTGSTDGITQEVAKKYADIFEVFTACNDPITGNIDDFSMARNRAFELSTKKYCGWIDGDDLLFGAENLRKLISNIPEQKENNLISFMFPYEYSYNESGQCTCRHYRERLFSNKNYIICKNPVHEVFCPTNEIQTQFITDDSVVYKHQRQYSNKIVESGRNLRILKKYVEKVGDTDARQFYYIGLEYLNNGFVNEAIEYLTKYVAISGWPDEICMACLKLVDIYQSLQKYDDGIRWAFKAIETCATWGEGYFALGKMFYFLATQGGPGEMRHWERCAYFSKLGLTLPLTKTLLFVNPLERDYEIHRYLNMALNKLGDVQGALDSTITGLKSQPNDGALLVNKKIYEVWLVKQQFITSINKLKELEDIDQKTADLLGSLINKQITVDSIFGTRTQEPQQMMEISEPVKEEKREISITTAADGKLDIVFYCGPGIQIWNPDTIKNGGDGGSEIMASEMAKRLAGRGHKVRVFASCGEEKNYDEVQYIPSEKYQNLTCDVLIISRRADMIEDNFNIITKLKLLWTHDIFPLNSTNARLLKFDRVLALSDWHREFMIRHCNLHPEHIITTRNAIDFNLFNKKVKRDQYKVINSSSPDRSWPILLQNWNRIKARVPKATLHLFYGMHNWKYSAQNDPKQMDLIHSLECQIKDMEAMGVVYHGRVNQETLAEHMLSAGVMAHPTFFTETFGINFASAQLAGLRIITSNCGALQTTVGNRGVLLDGEWTSQPFQNSLVENTVKALMYEGDEDRLELQKYAREHFGFDELVSDWEKMFYNLIELKKTNPIVPYLPTKSYR